MLKLWINFQTAVQKFEKLLWHNNVQNAHIVIQVGYTCVSSNKASTSTDCNFFLQRLVYHWLGRRNTFWSSSLWLWYRRGKLRIVIDLLSNIFMESLPTKQISNQKNAIYAIFIKFMVGFHITNIGVLTSNLKHKLLLFSLSF